MNLLADKQALEISHSHLRDLSQKLESELNLLQKEKAQALDKHCQVRDPWTATLFPALITWESNVDQVINSFGRVHGSCCHITCIRGTAHNCHAFWEGILSSLSPSLYLMSNLGCNKQGICKNNVNWKRYMHNIQRGG